MEIVTIDGRFTATKDSRNIWKIVHKKTNGVIGYYKEKKLRSNSWHYSKQDLLVLYDLMDRLDQ